MSVRLKLSIIFLVITSIPIILVSVLTFTNCEKALKNTRFSQLQDAAAFKADKIETYFAELKGNIATAQNFYNIKTNLPIMSRHAGQVDNAEAVGAMNMLDDQLRPIQKVLGLSDILLVNTEGKVVYVSNPEHLSEHLLKPLQDPEQKAFEQGKESIYLSSIFVAQPANRFEMLLTAPAKDFGGKLIGVIAFEIDMAPLYKLVQDATGLGQTGETLLGNKVGNEVVYLNPLRHDPEAALKRKVVIGQKTGGPIQQAVKGASGAGVMNDYRGVEVIAAWRYLPSLGWGMVAKIDAGEAFADIIFLRSLVIAILVIVIILSGIMAFAIAQSISEPIKKLSYGVELIGSGKLDHRIDINTRDEIGQLALSFNRMTEDLKKTTASRDDLNREITERRQAEDAMRKSEQRYRSFVEASSQIVWTTNAVGEVVMDIAAWQAYTGQSADEARGLGWMNAIAPEDRQRVADAWRRANESRGLYEVEYLLRTHDGKWRNILARGVPVFDSDGSIREYVGTCIDITQRKQAEEEIRRNMEELTRFNRSMAGREVRMIELKKEINDLCERLGEQKRYNLDFDKEQA